MTQSSVSGEGPTLSEALHSAAEQLGADSLEELSWSFVREHFRQGAWSVLVEAGLRTADEIEALKKGREAADSAAEWMREMLRLFGAEALTSDYPAMVAQLDAHPDIVGMNRHVEQKRLEEG